MKTKIVTAIFIILIICNCTIISYANETTNTINPNDLIVIEEIYKSNSKLIDWDIQNPLFIKNTEWELKDHIYYLVELDLSNTEIKGEINLSACNNLNYYSFLNTDINEVILPNHLETIPECAFENCSNLEYINIPQDTKLINNNAFKNCSNLKAVLLNGNNIMIDSGAFSGCVSLECISNANNIISIGRNAFTNCSNVFFYDNDAASSYIDNYIQTMNYQFSNNTNSAISGYVAIMTSSKEKYSKNSPYKAGTVYLYDEHNVLLTEQKLNSDGSFYFDNIPIGHRYKIIIDGPFAIERSKYIISSKYSNCLADKENPLHIVTCDFNNDGGITVADAGIIYQNVGKQDEESVMLYDLDGDSYITSSDAVIVYAVAGFLHYD